jgi:hypothetical protein
MLKISLPALATSHRWGKVNRKLIQRRHGYRVGSPGSFFVEEAEGRRQKGEPDEGN